jgi:hypothetical protein
MNGEQSTHLHLPLQILHVTYGNLTKNQPILPSPPLHQSLHLADYPQHRQSQRLRGITLRIHLLPRCVVYRLYRTAVVIPSNIVRRSSSLRL